MILISLLLSVVSGLCLSGDVNIVFDEKSFTVSSSYFEGTTVLYSDIVEAEQYDSCDMGIRLIGAGTPHLCTGIYMNRCFGKYRRYTYEECKAVIAVRTVQSVVVFNLETRKDTLRLYKAICETFE